MQLPLDLKIAGKKTVGDWLKIRASLDNSANDSTWEKVFETFFLARLEERYLQPIGLIKSSNTYSGEGFSVMVILCSLIEFLETTFQGINYRYVKRGEPKLGIYEYDQSKKIFVSFLTLRQPFAGVFNRQLAEDFYSDIRCGLLHEARTNGKWRIHGKSATGGLLDIHNGEIYIYRDNFFQAIQYYLHHYYKNELLKSDISKSAFLRKFDRLCVE